VTLSQTLGRESAPAILWSPGEIVERLELILRGNQAGEKPLHGLAVGFVKRLHLGFLLSGVVHNGRLVTLKRNGLKFWKRRHPLYAHEKL
jgi:hypothetical protein